MRTPRLLLGVFALALILLLPLLACGGSDEPERRASVANPTAALTRQTVSPTITPRPTARPPMAQTSPESDREALVALYNATGGPNWKGNDNWLSDVPISEWFGVTIDYNGHTQLYLRENRLSGEIPPELGNLARLHWLDLSENQLSGEMPPELGNLANLKRLDLSENQLSGEIPPELGNLANLQGLVLGGNQLSGCVPSSLLGRLYMDKSDLGGLQFCP